MDLYTWLEETAKMATGRGLKGNGPKRNFDLVLLDRDGSERRRYSIFQAWPTKFSAGDFDGESETDPLIETMELSIDYWEISKN
jgi:phage tail-like protein